MREIDNAILELISQIRSPLLDKIMIFFTKIGDDGVIWIIISALFLISRKTRRAGFVSLLALLLGLLLGNILFKKMFRRARPYTFIDKYELLIPEPSGFSFPSGHTTSSFASCSALSRYITKSYGILLYLLAVLIAFSRMYLYVHYPTDIIAGILLGLFCSFIAVKLFNFLKEKKILHKI